MRVLFVIPSEVSSGEAITVRHMAGDLVRSGAEVQILASVFAAHYLTEMADLVTTLGSDAIANRAIWEEAVGGHRPDVIVFADYALLFFPSGTAPLVDDDWVRSLDDLDAALVTLDHLGYAQGEMRLDFGPPHLSLASAWTPPLPKGMEVALPCPVQDPGVVAGRIGRPFRYWDGPRVITSTRADGVRRHYLDRAGDTLVVHSTPGWAVTASETWGLPYYRHLARILGDWLTGLPRPVTVVSVNDGHLLGESGRDDVRVRNVASIPPADFEALLLTADLVLTENSVSVGLGKAICGLRPAAVLRNSLRLPDLVAAADDDGRRAALDMERERLGAVFPFEVFPIWSPMDVARLGIHRDNRFADGFRWLEVFGGGVTRTAVQRLLLDEEERTILKGRQTEYADAVSDLPGPTDLLQAIAGGARVPELRAIGR